MKYNSLTNKIMDISTKYFVTNIIITFFLSISKQKLLIKFIFIIYLRFSIYPSFYNK